MESDADSATCRRRRERVLARICAVAAVLLSAAGSVASAHAEAGTSTRSEAGKPAEQRPQAPPVQGGGAVIVPADEQAADGQVDEPPGPGVELITGGNSADGAARIGRLPILE